MQPFSKAILTLVDYLLRRIANLFNEKDRKNKVKRAKGNGGSYFFLVLYGLKVVKMEKIPIAARSQKLHFRGFQPPNSKPIQCPNPLVANLLSN
jgi:hypothetical protein